MYRTRAFVHGCMQTGGARAGKQACVRTYAHV